MYQRDQNSSLFLGGERTSGQDVRASNGNLFLFFIDMTRLFFKIDQLNFFLSTSSCCRLYCQYC